MFQIAKNLPGIEVGPNTEQICVIHQSGSKKNLDICTKRTKFLLCLLICSMKCILAFIKLIIHQLINALILLLLLLLLFLGICVDYQVEVLFVRPKILKVFFF